MRLGVNGTGRIGKCLIRALYETSYIHKVDFLSLNTTFSIDSLVHFLRYDSVHGPFSSTVRKVDENTIAIDELCINVFFHRDPSCIPWENIDIVVECTGAFNDKISTEQIHLNSGVKSVLISAPSKDADKVVVFGVNHDLISVNDRVISAASCTSNAVLPLVKVLRDTVGITSGFITTIHSYTKDQNLLDGNHSDLHRSRASNLSIIPTTTGVGKVIGNIFPDLEDAIGCVALRVPTPNVSLIDFTFFSDNSVSAEELNSIFINAASSNMKGVIGICDEPLVSVDFNHSTESAILDLQGTAVKNKNLCRISSWYDNEWAFSMRLLDLLSVIHSKFE